MCLLTTIYRTTFVPAPSPVLPNLTPVPVSPARVVPAQIPAQIPVPAPQNMASSPESRAPQFKEHFDHEISGTGFENRQNKRNDRIQDKKRLNLESLRSYLPGKAVDPPFLLPGEAVDFDEPDEAPIPANLAPAYPANSYPREDDSSSVADSSQPMSAFIRAMADQAEAMELAMEQEINEDDESENDSTRSIRTIDMDVSL
jgi:hypothetical protein